MQGLELFIERIDGFDQFSSSEKIKYFAYFLLYELNEPCVTSKLIEECFEVLRIKPYSNVPSYLSTKAKGKGHIFLKTNKGYFLERGIKEKIGRILGVVKTPQLSNNYFPISLLENTRGYIEKVARQAIASYDAGIYDGCLVLTRKLIETLIIELFEKRKLENQIKGPDNNFYYLSDLISKLLKEPSWTISRNASQGLSPVKKLGDLSAHNRRFNATKSDIDKVSIEVRIVIEELVHLIDF